MPYDLMHPPAVQYLGDEVLFDGMSNHQADVVESWMRILPPEQQNWRAGMFRALKVELYATAGEPPWGDLDINSALMTIWTARGCDTPYIKTEEQELQHERKSGKKNRRRIKRR
jgi:hypothetical protein